MTSTYHNTPAMGCQTCRFLTNRAMLSSYWCCGKAGGAPCVQVLNLGNPEYCRNFSGWLPIPPKPPRRSLRRWILETFWE